VSREFLKWHAKVLAEQPDLHGEPLYLEILMRRGGLDAPTARSILRRAVQTFDWHSDRELRFYDVVLIVAFDEYVQGRATAQSLQADLGRAVARYVPQSL
jgi:hypothetical protein